MFAPLRAAVRADVDRQVGWAQDQARRQIRHVALVAGLATVAVLAAVGALVFGLVALQSWLATQIGWLPALGAIGGGLLLLTLVLALSAVFLRRPRLAARPKVQIARAAALFAARDSVRSGQAIEGGGDTLRMAMSTLREGSRSELLGALALIAVVGLIAGRRLRSARAKEK